jgi:serine/threonine-protein kinase RsbW
MIRSGEGERQGTVELRIAARSENLSLARLALAGVAVNAGAPDEVVADLKLAVTEACTNAIQHAYRGFGENDDIVVRYTVEEEALAIEVEDSGIGFGLEPSLANQRQSSDNLGLGLMIIRELVDELSVASGSWGSRIVFVKRFSPEH